VLRRRVVAIVGPTATGKSALAMHIARELGGEIVNADSRQVYRGMDVGTAKPSKEDREAIPHHLYDIAEPQNSYSLALYIRDARAALDDIWRRGATPILVGGTGQYLWGLLEAWTVPEVAPDIDLRDELSRFTEEHGPEQLHARLAEVDPVSATRIGVRNVRRIVRALEVFEHTGKPFSEWQRKGDPGFDFLVLGMDLPDDELQARIEARVDEMFAAGFVDEVRALVASGLPSTDSAMSSIGYREVAAYLEGLMTLQEARNATVRATRRLVRRQRQWFRTSDPRIQWVEDGNAALRLTDDFLRTAWPANHT
jgi:tRNA dimethylallyltransferase